MKKKLNLNEFHVKSFITTQPNPENLKGAGSCACSLPTQRICDYTCSNIPMACH